MLFGNGQKGAIVILAYRNEEKTLKVVEEIKAQTENPNVKFIQLNLLKLSSVKDFTDQFLARHNKLHTLITNAGVMVCPFNLSEDGIEA
ncbi:hypothetical protein INT46_005825 [Mucor plumbeus]|uniref:Uncharacterized protein n=1 Tax=Mucor plumbeus TaxID=97098 RepID=A0A8H7URQ4_9FUNG|nr:hypothetical protein INT46_005825 [Mucor plumbeus]